MAFDMRKCPFPWYGGKAKASPLVWQALGDVPHYVEPFAGSLAVLLNRPHECNRTYYSETVNDLDGFLVNAWRGIQLQPDATAEAASNPVCEADLHARHLRLLRWRAENDLERLMGDPHWCDPLMAGWWLWGVCSWIGSGFCSGDGPWQVDDDGRMVKRSKPGVSRQRPHLTDDGRGVNHASMREPGVSRQLPNLYDYGRGVNRPQMREPGTGEPEYHPVTMPRLREWFGWLSARLRHVRILNGDWRRAVTTGAALTLPVRQGKGPAGIFLDPPYAESAGRNATLYTEESLTVAHDVADWAIKTGTDARYRIVLAGFEGEHGSKFHDAGWREVEWFKSGFLTGGMGNQNKNGHQQHRERLWLSPHCLEVEGAKVVEEDDASPLFAGMT